MEWNRRHIQHQNIAASSLSNATQYPILAQEIMIPVVW